MSNGFDAKFIKNGKGVLEFWLTRNQAHLSQVVKDEGRLRTALVKTDRAIKA